jgi:hypothetical protein
MTAHTESRDLNIPRVQTCAGPPQEAPEPFHLHDALDRHAHGFRVGLDTQRAPRAPNRASSTRNERRVTSGIDTSHGSSFRTTTMPSSREGVKMADSAQVPWLRISSRWARTGRGGTRGDACRRPTARSCRDRWRGRRGRRGSLAPRARRVTEGTGGLGHRLARTRSILSVPSTAAALPENRERVAALARTVRGRSAFRSASGIRLWGRGGRGGTFCRRNARRREGEEVPILVMDGRRNTRLADLLDRPHQVSYGLLHPVGHDFGSMSSISSLMAPSRIGSPARLSNHSIPSAYTAS